MSLNREGWALPAFSRKWHYFVDSFSMCREWLFSGPVEQGNDDSPDNCAVCARKLKKLKEVRNEK